MSELQLYCQICTNREPPIGLFNLEDLVYPITGAMFRSPDPAHEVPPPFDPAADWRACICRRCRKRAFIDEDKVLTNVGYIKVKRLPLDAPTAEAEATTPSEQSEAVEDTTNPVEQCAGVQDTEVVSETTEEPTPTVEVCTGVKGLILSLLDKGESYRKIAKRAGLRASWSYVGRIKKEGVARGLLTPTGRLTEKGAAVVVGAQSEPKELGE